jgi:hypothetical protein|tara:strand:- start:219 stop:455 length:237 start_codon:yes stop_codon:yes gene_type:complete
MSKEIKVGKVYSHKSSFNGEKFSSKVIVLEKDEQTSTKKNPHYIVFQLTTPKICKKYRQILRKHNYFWTTPDKLQEVK